MSTTLLIQKSKHENSETLYKASTLQQIWTLLLSPLFVPLSFVFTWLSRESTAASNPFLQENYAPIDHESDSVPAKVVQGQIPSDLNGVFARIGPNPRATTNGDYHWFDGNGMIHGVKIGNQSASLLYHSNQLKIPRQLEQDRIGLVVYFQIGWLMGSSPLAFLGKMVWGALLKAVGYAKSFPALHLGQANTALEVYEGKLLATHEASLPFHIAVDKEDGSFESMGYHDFEGTLQHAMTAHPKVDKETGEMIFFGYSFDNEKAFCSYSVIKDGVVKCTMELSRDDLLAGYPKMMHDFAITPNYSILLDLPLIFDVKLAMRAKMPIVFQKDLPARVAVFNRYPSGTHSIKWFHITSCAIFHTFGAWEERNSVGDLIIGLAACRLPDFSMKIRKVGGFTRPYLYKFNLTTGETVEERCIFSTLEGHDFSIDFPRIHPDLLGKPFRYGYAAVFLDKGATPDVSGVVKIDFTDGKTAKIMFGEGKLGGESYFLPKQGSVREDEGYLLTFVHNKARPAETELWVMDSATMNSSSICKILVPVRIPHGFHCRWISADEIGSQDL